MGSQLVPRVVVTGLGALTPLGLSAEATWQGLVAGRSGITPIRHFDARESPVRIAGRIHDFEPRDWLEPRELRRMPRFTQLILAAAEQAVGHAGLDWEREDRTRVGVEIGNATGSVETTVAQYDILREQGARRLVPTIIPGALINMGACQVAMRYGLQGPGGAPVAACATGLYAIGDAMRRLQRGEVEVMVAGAGESFLDPLAIAAFWRIQALSTRNDAPEAASRPFDAQRDGTVMSEGAAVLVLETEQHALARGATILGEIAGYGQSMDAWHMIAPEAQGRGAQLAMRAALHEAQIDAAQVDWLSAHATATPLNDLAEVRAIKQLFGAAAYTVPVSGLKSMLGHTLGAAGAVSVVAALLALRDGIVPPTLNLDQPDLPELDLDFVPHRARARRVLHVLCNAFGFGGQNASIVVSRYGGGSA